MSHTVEFTDDPGVALERARAFLATKPFECNLIASLLQNRVQWPEAGRYWIISDAGEVVGVVFQSPSDFPATITPMSSQAAITAVAAIADAGIDLPGVSGEAYAASHFAGQWSDRSNTAAVPLRGERLYVLGVLSEQSAPSGQLRLADDNDRELLTEWLGQFQHEIGEASNHAGEIVDRRVALGHFYIWDDGEPVSMAAKTESFCGVRRIGPVYTPLAFRRRGYAGACVGALSRLIRDGGDNCILYTDLGNPTSNSVYRQIGYRATAGLLRYDFRK